MNSCKKILHIAPTPLVGSPEKISEALNKFTDYDSSVVILKDYPGDLKGNLPRMLFSITRLRLKS